VNINKTFGSPHTNNRSAAELEFFKRAAGLSEADMAEFKRATINTIKDFVRDLHLEQEKSGYMKYLRRLDVFVLSMEEYWRFVETTEIFINYSEASACLWVSCSIL
jgi:hypothetical protein